MKIAELNDKWWYRLVKVFFIGFFVIIIFITLFLSWDSYRKADIIDVKNSSIRCTFSGELLSLNNIIVVDYIDSIDYFSMEKIRDYCADTSRHYRFDMAVKNGNVLPNDYSSFLRYDRNIDENNYVYSDYVEKLHKVSDVSEKNNIIFYAFISLLVELFIFLGLSLLFKYIVTGKFYL